LNVLEIISLLKKLKIDILHTHEARSDLLGCLAAKISDTPVVTTMHGWIANSRRQRTITKINKWAARFFDRVIVVNGPMRDDLLKEGIPSRIISVLHNCIVKENYYRDYRAGYISKCVGREIGSPLIGTIGRLSPEKGHGDFVEAAAIVISKGYKAHFVIVGDGPEAGNIDRMISGKGLRNSVTMTGYLRDPRRVLQDFDLMVLPSYSEGLPNVVLESLMMEVPVVSTAVGGVPEIIRDGEGGVLIPPGEPEKIAEAIMGFLDAPEKYKTMARNMKKTVENKFDFGVRTKKLEKIYLEVMNRKGIS
jgi:glycosyltransferase involved in cell wall biosynthesis